MTRAAFCAAVSIAFAAAAKPSSSSALPEIQRPVAITAEKLEISGKKNQAVWVGHVKAKRGSTHLTCDRLVAHYTANKEIARIECIGRAEVVDGDRWAKGDRADFDNLSGILVVTGSPEARQGKNHMRGTQVVFNVGKDTLEVKNATTVFETTPQGAPVLPSTKRKGSAP